MKAAQITSYGGQDAVQVTADAAKPAVGTGQVLVEVYTAAVNPFDVHIRDGAAKDYIKLELPATLGGDVAGTVAEVGEGVTGFEVGQAVFGMANAAGGRGSFAEFTTVRASQLIAKPQSIDFPTAAAMTLTGVSAYQALVDHANLQASQKILIHGGAGGIGSLAIQLAKHLGAYVATTAAAEEAEFVRDLLGADEVIDYKTQDFSQILENYDVVYDTVGGETNAKSYQVLKPSGTLVSMVQGPDEKLVDQHKITYVQQASKATPERLAKVAELVEAGTLHVNIDKIFPLDQAAEALEYLKTGHPRGKVVIQVKQ